MCVVNVKMIVTVFLTVFLVLPASTRNYVEINVSFNNEDDFDNDIYPPRGCFLKPNLIKEIRSYRSIVERIFSSTLNGTFKGQLYHMVADFVDTFGHRMSGTENLENSFDYLMQLFHSYGLDNIHNEYVMVPHWVRGHESATMLQPRNEEFSILGLGGSVATPPKGIIASVLVVNSFEELKKRASEAAGKIVVYNQDYVSYGESVKYRTKGASEAARVGAVAALVRSITPFSINSPHTGQQDYDSDVKKIPVASITVEVAQMLRRMSENGKAIIIRLYMEARSLPDKKSRNLVGELEGNENPNKVVLVSGHIDSWDVGQGAMDDAAGAFVSWFSVAVLKALNLRPKRTVRAVMWTAEEPGLWGVRQYVKAHLDELNDFNLVMESDEGTFKPDGIEFTGTSTAACIMQEIGKLMKPLDATKFETKDAVGSDITAFVPYGVPSAVVSNKDDKYFYFHHTDGDMMTVEDSDDLDKNVAIYAAIAYVVADLSIDLPNTVRSYRKTKKC